MKTIPSRRKKIVGGGVGMKGIISALAMSPDGLLAAGTFGRWLGLYNSGGRGGVAGLLEIGKNSGVSGGAEEGAGITQLLWSSCGRYLCVVERRSDGIGVWDVRNTGRKISWLRGRKANTMQRLGAELVNRQIWAGGMDGAVRMWDGLGMREGIVDPELESNIHDGKLIGDIANWQRLTSGGPSCRVCGGNSSFWDYISDLFWSAPYEWASGRPREPLRRGRWVSGYH